MPPVLFASIRSCQWLRRSSRARASPCLFCRSMSCRREGKRRGGLPSATPCPAEEQQPKENGGGSDVCRPQTGGCKKTGSLPSSSFGAMGCPVARPGSGAAVSPPLHHRTRSGRPSRPTAGTQAWPPCWLTPAHTINKNKTVYDKQKQKTKTKTKKEMAGSHLGPAIQADGQEARPVLVRLEGARVAQRVRRGIDKATGLVVDVDQLDDLGDHLRSPIVADRQHEAAGLHRPPNSGMGRVLSLPRCQPEACLMWTERHQPLGYERGVCREAGLFGSIGS